MSRSRPALLTSILLLCGAVAGTLVAHVDDSKVFDRIPAYQGPGYKAAEGSSYRAGGGSGGGSGGEGGVAADVNQFTSSGITLLSWLPLSEWPGASNANVVEGYVSQSGREYALLGLSSGMAVVEVTNPGNATKIAFLPGPTSLWRDIRTFGTHAYAVSEGGGGIQVFDLSQVDAGVVSQVNQVTTGGGSATHTLFINRDSGYLYRAGGNSGLRIYSLADPANPAFVAEWADRYVHEVTVVNYTSGPYAGKEIAFACGGLNGGWVQTGLSILDVTNKGAISVLTHYEYPSARYSHQAWPTQDLQYLYLNDEKDEQDLGLPGTTRIIDISNLSAPVQVGTWTNGLAAIDHNLYVKGSIAFLSNYRSGLRVLDVSSPQAPVETAWFDTFPNSNSASFNGLWDCDPYLPSGIVLGSDIERGLFVWYVGPPPLGFSYPDGLPDLVSPDGQELSADIAPLQGQEVDPTSVRLVLTTGGGTIEVPATSRDGVRYTASIPALPCLDEITYSFVAKATNGIELSSPTPGVLATVAYGRTRVFLHDFETESGWSVGAPGDTAFAGLWTRVDPVGTTAQPEDDRSPDGTLCWVTGQGVPGGGAGAADVDGGATTLLSHVFDATGDGEAMLTYWRWYSNNLGNNPNEDTMPILISGDGGATWTLLEDVAENTGQWTRRSVRIADHLPPTATMRLKFVAQDFGFASLVEAGVDDVGVDRYFCEDSEPALAGDFNDDGVVDAGDLGILLGGWGQPGPTDLNGDGSTDGGDLGLLLFYWTP